MVHGLGAEQRTITVVFPQGRLPGGNAGSSAAQKGRFTRASNAPSVISTWPGKPADCTCRKFKTTAWISRGSCFRFADADAATGCERSRTKLRLHDRSRK